ncbi:hypothetical protein [Streptomyces antimicrobicus]|uniref:Integral membrane protein n=1 Tax=Streptomyces antimicrobicus TaxID=2883108 RepID=A0ABS8B1L0_9ACTN|nr:hypothetical protein [Streptomyces antimicrobicus]MCB5178495.1 hypothetical protein [Streptomyces antimicrobicus]
MLRRIVAAAAAVVLVVEAAAVVVVHLVLGRATAGQSMSIAGSDPDVMSKATYALGAGLGAFLVLCAALLAVAAVRDRPPGRFGRVLLIGAAVTNGVLSALVAALVGWGAFAALTAVLCLLVLFLVLHGRPEVRPGSAPTGPGPHAAGTGPAPDAGTGPGTGPAGAPPVTPTSP